MSDAHKPDPHAPGQPGVISTGGGAMGSLYDQGIKSLWDSLAGQSTFQSGQYVADPNAAGDAVLADQNNQTGNLGQDRQTLLAQAAGINNTAAGMNTSIQHMDTTANNISGLSDQLGNAPSAAAAAARAAAQTGNAQAMSQAASARGANSALMMREAQSNNDARDRAIASDAAAASANEMNGRYATRAQMLGTAAGVQQNIAGVQANQAGAQTQAANVVQNAAGNGVASRGADLAANTAANQTNEAGFDSSQKLDEDIAKSNAAGEQKAAGGVMTAIGGAVGMSDIRAKEDIKPDKNTASTLTALLEQATRDDGKPMSTRDVGRSFDRDALDRSQLASGGRIYGPPPGPSQVPSARFADYQPPTARFDDAPASQAAAPQTDSGFDLAALDAAYRREGDPSYVTSDENTKTDRRKTSAVSYSKTGDAPYPTGARAPESPYQSIADASHNAGRVTFRVTGDDAYPRNPPMTSDKDTKTDRVKLLEMAASPSANRKDLEPVEGYTYRYKPDVAARIGMDTDTRPGVMAQDVEKSPAGEQVVVETPEGKGLDIHRALGFSLAGVAGLDKRLKLLEQAAGRKGKAA